MFILNKINVGQILDLAERINIVNMRFHLTFGLITSFSDYYEALVFLKNLNPDSLNHVDLVFCTKLMNFDPEWFIVYTDDEGFNIFSRTLFPQIGKVKIYPFGI